ncbi:hypothetical protein FNK43_01585 [Staphylococcus agnetis]|nr:hypothetical protein [Staphylococcus agnetis]NJH67433.1 hypothetical protein [Staphylococcus agnetis]NJH85809.1 hypothetical protein [Staphylococcus agnetis]NJI15342.1 hypothetical protein [Staphylococcus agnetis]PTH38840.1 hypothetical protein BU588_09505 [Staphylococcus agnetis]
MVINIIGSIWEVLSFLYSNFSFPLLSLVIIIIYRKEISSMLNRINTIKYSGNAGEVCLILNNIKRLEDEMEDSINNQVRKYGDEVKKTGQFGSGSKNDDNFYFDLIHSPHKTGLVLAEKGPYKTIENLYEAYNFFIQKYTIVDDRNSKIVKDIYDNTVDLKNQGGYLLDENFVYEYRRYIEITLRGLEMANKK